MDCIHNCKKGGEICERDNKFQIHLDVAQPISVSRNAKSKFNLVSNANEEQKKLIEKYLFFSTWKKLMIFRAFGTDLLEKEFEEEKTRDIAESEPKEELKHVIINEKAAAAAPKVLVK